ncbi:hypothetical protein BRAS3843_230080 [Bradyrhizobium sp. STM 3843]|nr:hypothetical protein BRAS3843_230080 [Bradyrhizobium sp. STM 3843]
MILDTPSEVLGGRHGKNGRVNPPLALTVYCWRGRFPVGLHVRVTCVSSLPCPGFSPQRP